MSRLRCEVCRRVVKVSELGARVTGGIPDRDLAWCLACWDDGDEVALNQYRVAQGQMVSFRWVKGEGA